MTSDSLPFLNKTQRYVVLTVTLGNILEWYDIYLYIYWLPTISKLFFQPGSQSVNLFNAIAFFTLGFLFRPLGGIFFGRLGDRFGRKLSFILSILLMTIPTFVFGLLPVYSQIGIFAPILLALIRILQTFPSGGELPGVFCYLYENAGTGNRKFMSSFAGIGNQIGIILSAVECFLIERFLPDNIYQDWGWRISFIIGGFIGLGGLFLRYKLHETKLFQEVVNHHAMSRKSIVTVIKDNWKKMLTGISFGAAQTVSFHFISILFPIIFYKKIDNNQYHSISLIVLLTTMTIILPFFGLLADRFGVRKLLIGSCVGILVLLYPLNFLINNPSLEHLWILICFVLCISCMTALWPYLISNLFPTQDRYTCVGLSFNIGDGFFGGLSTLAALFLFDATSSPESFSWLILISCIISLISFIKLRN